MKNDKKRKTGYSAGTVTRGAVYIALGVIALILPFFFESTDILVASFVAIAVAIARTEHGLPFGFAVYGGISLLSVILMPSNSGALLFAASFGWFPLLHVLLMQKLKKPALVRLIDCLAFTVTFVFVVILFFKSFVSGAETAESVRRAFEFFSLDSSPALAWISQPSAFGKTRAELLTLGLYALFALPFSLIFSYFFDVFNRIYIYKIRPRLKQAKIVK